MGANMKHYTKDGEYKGETHKMNGKIHTGAKHGETSEVVSHKKGGPFTMKGFSYPGTSPLQACWENYEMFGTKMKDGKKVPNCVPRKKK
jgi:hypothetical protein